MVDRDALTRIVLRNCDISDARHAGILSVCGLALRLRDLFKWERGLAAWEEGAPAEVLDWIGLREERWESLAEAEYDRILLAEFSFDPFDTDSINTVLEPHGLYYGAGYARGLKPTFFLAEIEDRREWQGVRVYRLSREYARDLLTLPALSQEQSIILRRDSARLHLWDQISYAGAAGRRALAVVRDACGLPDLSLGALKRHFGDLLKAQESLLLHHELGEMKEETFDRGLWREIIGQFPHTGIELMVRHIKDLLADTHPAGTLHHICRNRDRAGLGLFMLFLTDFTRVLAPRMVAAFDEVVAGANWDAVERAVEAGYIVARQHADFISAAYCRRKAQEDLSGFQTEMDRMLERFTRRD